MKKLRENLLTLSEGQKWQEMEELLISSTEKDILSVLKKTVFHKEGPSLLNGVLKSLQCKERESILLKFKIYKAVLKLIECTEDSNENENGKLVTVLLVHVDLFPSYVLVDLIDYFIEHLSAGLPFYGRWTAVLGKLLGSVVLREDIKLEGNEITGEDFLRHIVKTICNCKWNSQTTTWLLPIFKELRLPKDDIIEVIEKLKVVLQDVPYQSLPPIIYHMILMGQGAVPSTVLKAVMEFFNGQESSLCNVENEKESNGIEDLGESERIGGTSKADLVEAQGTVILHITQLAQYESSLMKDYFKILKMKWLPGTLFTSFNLALALSLASIDRHKDQILDSLKACILKYYKMKERRWKSLWLSEAFKEPLNLHQVFRSTVKNCSSGWDQVSKGFVLLCFSLLESGGGTKGETYASQQMMSLASSVLPIVFKKEPHLAPEILKQLSNFIYTASSPLQYIELLGRLVKVSPLVLLDHVSLVRDILEQLVFLPFRVATMVLCTLLPVVKMSMTLKDALVIILRKMLFSKQVETRMAAVQGFVQVLRYFRVLGVLPSSQASMSFSSTLSQISADVHSSLDNSTNEALCLELLGVLRRCFTQQSEVRSSLYSGLIDVSRANPKLIPNILQFLHQHFLSFVSFNENTLNPILFEKTVSVQGENVTLVEPLGKLVSCLSICKTCYESSKNHGNNADDEEDSGIVDSMNEICSSFDFLTDKLSHCDLDDLNFDNASFLSNTTDGKKNIHYAQIIVAVFDSLIEQNFKDDALMSEAKMKIVLALFKTRKRILDHVKEKSKSGKKSSESSKSKGRPAAGKQVSFISVLSLSTAVKMLKVSLIGDDDAAPRSVELILGNGDLQVYLISVVDQVLAELKTVQPYQKERLLPHLKTACHLLFKECLKKFPNEEHEDDDKENSRLRHCLSTLFSILESCVKYFKDKLPQIFKELTGKSVSKQYESLLYYVAKSCCKMLLKVFQCSEPSNYSKDAIILIQIINLVVDQMELNSKELIEVQDMVNQLCKDYSVTHPSLAESLVQLLFTITDRVKMTSNICRSLAREIHYRLGDIEEDVAVEETCCYKIVTESSAPVILNCLCLYCDDVSSILELALFKLKETLVAGEQYDVQDMDKMISLKFAMTIHALHEVFQSAIPHGPHQDHVLKITTRFYNCMGVYVKYYSEYYKYKPNPQMSEKFEKLIHLCSNMLKEYAFKMINYMHNTQMTAQTGKKSKSTNTNRALKESKLIPALVFAMEQYENHLMQLGKKSKVNLLSGTKITTSRDFRIVGDTLQEAIRRAEEDKSEEDEDEEQQDKENDDRDENDSDEERLPPKKKKKSI